ncbi:MAG: DUF2723 domain-containing protein [Chloroflexota bacterium]|nr:DUF2723 domain-containing protein [Chloroflexota bacterium]
MKNLNKVWNERRDLLISTLLFILAFALYVRTVAPSVAFLFDDTLEFQYVVPRLGILHPTGYPLYALLGKLFTLLVPLNDPAFRLNLLSALNGALAVALVYFVARHVVAHRFAALIAALMFAVGQTFWSQAVIAETYTTQMLIVALLFYLALIWREEIEQGNTDNARHRFYALAFAMGLGLTHHRLIALLYPAIVIYVLLIDRAVIRDWRLLARAAVFFLAPLLLYLYLPLRGAVGSADGTYQNSLSGFIDWVTAKEYTVFLTGNPFQVQRDATYYSKLFLDQFGILGLALAAIGIVWLLRRPREWTLLTLALIAETGFAFNYRVENVYVHFLTTFLLLALFAGAGADGMMTVMGTWRLRVDTPPRANPRVATVLLLSIFFLLIPLQLLIANYAANDLSNKWDMHDYGLDILNQPLEKNATIIGIQGEMTLLRYFQENQGLHPEVQTIAADKEPARLAAVADALAQNRVVYLTRPLKGIEENDSLDSVGPLIRVLPKAATDAPRISHPLDPAQEFGAVRLIGYDMDASRLTAIQDIWHAESGRFLRVTLYWQATDKIANDTMVSLKLLRGDQRVFGQIDHRPVLDAYPTTAWRPGEIIADTYALPLSLGVTPGDYVIDVTMYDANSGNVIGQHPLDRIALDADVTAPRREAQSRARGDDVSFAQALAGYSLDEWNIAHVTDDDLGALSLAGYSLDVNSATRPGDTLPLMLLWRAGAKKLPDNLLVRVWLENSNGDTIASRDTPISVGYPPFLWQPGAYVRDWPLLRVPANVADGKYSVRLAVARNNQLLGSALLPFYPSVVKLGQIEIKSRPRLLTAPAVPRPLEVAFDNKIRLLGYDVTGDPAQRTIQITLYWKSLAQMDTSYTVFTHLLDSSNVVRASGDAVPGNGDLPTTTWIEGEYLTDVHTMTLPTDLPAGAYTIEIGVYDPATGARLNTADGQDHLILTSVNMP